MLAYFLHKDEHRPGEYAVMSGGGRPTHCLWPLPAPPKEKP